MKDYTYSLSAKNGNGEVVTFNETDKSKGYRKSWFKTEEAARKTLKRMIEFYEQLGYTEIEWTLYSKIKGIGIIETNI